MPPNSFIADFVPRRPAVLVACVFMVGVAVHSLLPPRPIFLLSIASFCTIAAAMWVRHEIRSSGALIGAVFLAAAAAAQLAHEYFPRHHIAAFASDEPNLAWVQVRIDTPPRLISMPADARALPPRQICTASALRVKTNSGWQSASGDILFRLNEPHPRLALGQIVRVVSMLQRPAPAMNPGQFDWAKYYREQGVLASLHVPHLVNIEIIDQKSIGPIAWLRQRTRQLLAAGFSSEQSLDHALLRALLVGDTDPELRDVQEQFKRSGTSHHLAISGMHVAVLGGFVYLICHLLRLRPRATAWITLGFVILYGAVALPSPPVVRSILLCTIFALGLLHRRTADPMQLLAVTVIAMLIYHPMDFYNAGFQLSFVTVLGLIIFTRPLSEFFMSFRDRDRMLATKIRPPTGLAAVMQWLDRKAVEILAGAIVAWVVSLPLIALHFEQLSVWSIAGSVVLAPVVFLALIGGVLKILLTLLIPGAAGFAASVAAIPVGWMRWLVELFSDLPGSGVPLPGPPLWQLLAFYLLVLLALTPFAKVTLRLLARSGPFVACGSVLLLPLHTQLGTGSPAHDELRVTLLAVGGGQCAVVEPPSGRVVFIDAGSASLPDLVYKCVGPYLRHRRQTEVDTIVISHANNDHFSAADEIAAMYDVREILTSAHFERHAKDNLAARRLLSDLDALERPPRTVAPPDVIPLGRDTSIEIIWPGDDRSLAANDSSLVLRLRHGSRSILFTGDIQEPALRQLVEKPEGLRSDVLIAPHHGSSEKATDEFIAAVDPQFIVSSNDRTLSRKQVDFEEMVDGRPLYRTHRCGAVTIYISLQGDIRVEPYLQTPPLHAPPLDYARDDQ